jgi:chromosome segregation ATPase
MVIKKINLSKIEEYLKEIIESSTEIETIKEEVKDVSQALGNNNIEFKSGKISKEVFDDIKNNLEKEKKMLENKISVEKKKISDVSNELSNFMKENKV